jgi:hypothetical protein
MLKRIYIFPIKIYSLIISPLIGGYKSCRFTPTCSQYAIDAIEKLGIIKGTFAAISRIIRCNPWGGSGYDPVDNKKHHNLKK